MDPQLPASGTGLLHLPNELLLEIFGELSDETLYHLAITCHRLHVLALPLVFNRHNSGGCVTLYTQGMRALPALRISPSVICLTSINCWLSPDGDVLLRQVHSLSCLISERSSITNVTLNLPNIYFWMDVERIDLEQWNSKILGLLNAIIGNSCSSLTVNGGENIPHESAAIIHRPAARSPQTSGIRGSLIRDPFRFLSERLRHNTLPAFNRMRKAVDRKLSSMQHVKESDSEPSKSTDKVTTLAPLLNTFRINSSFLFYASFYDWTINTLNRAPISILSIGVVGCFKFDLSTEIWAQVLPSLTLPTLTELIVGSSSIAFVDLSKFLARHPSITTLDLSNMSPLPPHSLRIPKGIIPRLTTLRADPQYLLHLLESEDVFPDLDSITVVQPSLKCFLNPSVDYTTIGVLLHDVLHRRRLSRKSYHPQR